MVMSCWPKSWEGFKSNNNNNNNNNDDDDTATTTAAEKCLAVVSNAVITDL